MNIQQEEKLETLSREEEYLFNQIHTCEYIASLIFASAPQNENKLDKITLDGIIDFIAHRHTNAQIDLYHLKLEKCLLFK